MKLGALFGKIFLFVMIVFIKNPLLVYAYDCDPGEILSLEEKQTLIEKIQNTETGKKVIEDFLKRYGDLNKLIVQWDSISYSQIIRKKNQNRSIASDDSYIQSAHKKSLSSYVCVHLTKKLPEIEHVADLVHELTHAVYLEDEVLHGTMDDVDDFVRARIAGVGGEAHAFSVECKVKQEILKTWDQLCMPYVSDSKNEMDKEKVVQALYNGVLSASLTGETYPVMLSKQFSAGKKLTQKISAKK